MDLISLVILLVIFGVCLWLIHQIPMDAKIRTIIDVVVILVLVLWLLNLFGVGHIPLTIPARR